MKIYNSLFLSVKFSSAKPRMIRSIQFLIIQLIILLCCGEINAQTSLETLINNVRESNKTLISAQQLYEAEVVSAKKGNSPDNPELEYAYLWGSPVSLGERIDFEITQTVDFPTAYFSRNKLSKISRDQARLKLKTKEQEIITNARSAWIMAVYYNKLNALLNIRLSNIEMISDAYLRLFNEGEANQIELNQANLKEISLRNKTNKLEIDINSNNTVIARLNGGQNLEITDTLFPQNVQIAFDTLIDWYKTGPQNAIFQSEIIKMESQKNVAFNQKLPKLKAGYYQETILGAKMAGIKAGITIPLWGNANDVKSAKAVLVFAQSDAERFWEQQEFQVKRLYDQWLMLQKQVNEMEELLINSNNGDLLFKALEAGEISLTQYYYESDFYFDNQIDLLELQRNLHLVQTELLKVIY